MFNNTINDSDEDDVDLDKKEEEDVDTVEEIYLADETS